MFGKGAGSVKTAFKKAYSHKKKLDEAEEVAKHNPEKEAAEEQAAQERKKQQITASAQEAKQNRQKNRQEGYENIEALYQRPIKAYTPEQEAALRNEANSQVRSNMMSAERHLLGEQGRHGIVGKGGIGYAQRRDLQRVGQEKMGEAQRALDRQISDREIKKLAQLFAAGEGEAALGGLDAQEAADELEYNEERKRQRQRENKFDRYFTTA